MKEPSELDFILVRDLMSKFFYADSDPAIRGLRVNITMQQFDARKAAFERIMGYYDQMEAEISRLVLEKNNVD